MIIIGCDFHTRYQQIAMADDETGELLLERRLDHESGEAQAFYRGLQGPVRVGIEATGPIHWFERCSRNSATNYGSATPRRFAPVKCASRRPTSATPGSFSICCWRNAFRKSGFPRPPNATFASYSGTVINWCACVRCWATNCTFWP